MIIMKNNFFYKMSIYIKNKNKNIKKINKFLFYLLKNYYLTLKRTKLLDYTPKSNIEVFLKNIDFLNVLKNKNTYK